MYIMEYVRMCMCVCVCVGMCVRVCVCALSALQLVWVPSLEASSSDSEGGGGSRVTRRDRSCVVYVWSKGTHSCIHPFVYFLRSCVNGGSVAVGTVVVSQGVRYCKYQGVAFVDLFLNPVEGGRHFELGI